MLFASLNRVFTSINLTIVTLPSRTETRISEADVQAFADGTLDLSRMRRMHRYLARRPNEARRVAFYERLNAQMHSQTEHPMNACRERS